MSIKSSDSIELDLSQFSKDELIYMIQKSCDQDVSVNKIIEHLLEEFLKAHSES